MVADCAAIAGKAQHRIEWRARPQTWPAHARRFLG
jgi:hypothetical protein